MHQDTDTSQASWNACQEIFDEAAWDLRRLAPNAMDALVIERVVVGVFVTGVKLSNGCGGVAFTSPEVVQQAGKRILKGHRPDITGMPAMAAAAGADLGPFGQLVRLATLNALSAPLLLERSRDRPGDDLAAYRPLIAGQRVCMVGAMIPLLKRLRELEAAEVLVADRKQETLALAEGCAAIDLERLPQALASCQTAIFTGATIPNGTLPGLLDLVSPQAAVAVIGPTAGFIPNPLFRRGVAWIGTTVITDADQTLDILAEGGGMYHLFDECVRKINLPNSIRLRQLGLERL